MRWSRFPTAFPFRFGRGPEVAAEVRAAIEAAENEAEIVEQQAQDDARANALIKYVREALASVPSE